MLSGNRNFEARIHPNLKANFLASPPLVVAYAIAGNVQRDLMTEPLGRGKGGRDVYLGDVWPSSDEIHALMKYAMNGRRPSARNYAQVKTEPGKLWEKIEGVTRAQTSTPGRTAPTSPSRRSSRDFTMAAAAAGARRAGRAHHGPVRRQHHHRPHQPGRQLQGRATPAGQYLLAQGVLKADFNSYGARRGNHEVMMRGTFANVRIKNLMLPPRADGAPRGRRLHALPAGRRTDGHLRRGHALPGRRRAHRRLRRRGIRHRQLSRDWAAKGTALLGIRAVVAKSFERIHRSNLIGMGVLPLQFEAGDSWQSLGLNGDETVDVRAGRRPEAAVGRHAA